MADDKSSRRDPEPRGFGDDQGTRVGRPTPPPPDQPGHLGVGHVQGGAAQGEPVPDRPHREHQQTGAGAEASEGIHAADGESKHGDRTALQGKPTGTTADGDRAGSEPQPSHDREHQSRYGGAGGEPKDS